MRRTVVISMMIACIAFVTACKKEDNDSSPTKKQPIINTPPASDYFAGVRNDANKYYATWTTNFKEYNDFTDEYNNVGNVKVDNGVLIILDNQNPTTAKYDIHFSSISELKVFTTVHSIYQPELISVSQSVVVAYSSTFNRIGICNTSVGETELSWSEMPANHTIFSLMAVVDGVMGGADVNGAESYVRISNLGQNTTYNSSGFAANEYFYRENTSWGLKGESWAVNSSSDWSTNWSETTFDPIVDGNTTDSTSAIFITGNDAVNVSQGNVSIYGTLQSQSTGIHYPAVNKSTDGGISWITSFLDGISSYTNNTSFSENVYSSAFVTIIDARFSANITPGLYISDDGVMFTQVSGDQLVNFDNFFNVSLVRP